MATLHVRHVPDDLYARLRGAAEGSRRSMSAEVIETLRQRLAEPDRGTLSFANWLERTAKVRDGAKRQSAVSAAELIREDRDR